MGAGRPWLARWTPTCTISVRLPQPNWSPIALLSPASLLNIKQALEDMEAAFSGERQRGLIPDDRLVTARLSELEVART